VERSPQIIEQALHSDHSRSHSKTVQLIRFGSRDRPIEELQEVTTDWRSKGLRGVVPAAAIKRSLAWQLSQARKELKK
jgi:hypothetical protein